MLSKILDYLFKRDVQPVGRNHAVRMMLAKSDVIITRKTNERITGSESVAEGVGPAE